MKVLVVADIHANWPALRTVLAAEPDADRILCLGDLVDYGPQPVECVAWAQGLDRLHWVLQGNHDRAVGLDEDPRCSASYRDLAEATRRYTLGLLAPNAKSFLAGLQPLRFFRLPETRVVACHALPRDPLYCYLTESSPVWAWTAELAAANHPDLLFLGHTHLPMHKRFGRTQVINPGSVGQPKDGDPRSAYAVWQDGTVSLRRVAYDLEETVHAYRSSGLDQMTVQRLCAVLRTGGQLPSSPAF
jgi:predicted phosphodiesterase